jgi:hypothetical protein
MEPHHVDPNPHTSSVAAAQRRWSEKRNTVKTSYEVLASIAARVRAAESKALLQNKTNVFISDRPDSGKWSTISHSKRNLDLVIEAHRSLMNTRFKPNEPRLVHDGFDAPVEGSGDLSSTSTSSTRHMLKIPNSNKPQFTTIWHEPRGDDLRLEAMRSYSLGIHKEPFVPAPERVQFRCSAAEAQYPFEDARRAAEAASSGRPATPRSVLSFFGVADEETYDSVDQERNAAWRSRVLRKISEVESRGTKGHRTAVVGPSPSAGKSTALANGESSPKRAASKPSIVETPLNPTHQEGVAGRPTPDPIFLTATMLVSKPTLNRRPWSAKTTSSTRSATAQAAAAPVVASGVATVVGASTPNRQGRVATADTNAGKANGSTANTKRTTASHFAEEKAPRDVAHPKDVYSWSSQVIPPS